MDGKRHNYPFNVNLFEQANKNQECTEGVKCIEIWEILLNFLELLRIEKSPPVTTVRLLLCSKSTPIMVLREIEIRGILADYHFISVLCIWK